MQAVDSALLPIARTYRSHAHGARDRAVRTSRWVQVAQPRRLFDRIQSCEILRFCGGCARKRTRRAHLSGRTGLQLSCCLTLHVKFQVAHGYYKLLYHYKASFNFVAWSFRSMNIAELNGLCEETELYTQRFGLRQMVHPSPGSRIA